MNDDNNELTYGDIEQMYLALKSPQLAAVRPTKATAKFFYACNINARRILPCVLAADEPLKEYSEKAAKVQRETVGDERTAAIADLNKEYSDELDQKNIIRGEKVDVKLHMVDFETLPEVEWGVLAPLMPFVRKPREDEPNEEVGDSDDCAAGSVHDA